MYKFTAQIFNHKFYIELSQEMMEDENDSIYEYIISTLNKGDNNVSCYGNNEGTLILVGKAINLFKAFDGVDPKMPYIMDRIIQYILDNWGFINEDDMITIYMF